MNIAENEQYFMVKDNNLKKPFKQRLKENGRASAKKAIIPTILMLIPHVLWPFTYATGSNSFQDSNIEPRMYIYGFASVVFVYIALFIMILLSNNGKRKRAILVVPLITLLSTFLSFVIVTFDFYSDAEIVAYLLFYTIAYIVMYAIMSTYFGAATLFFIRPGARNKTLGVVLFIIPILYVVFTFFTTTYLTGTDCYGDDYECVAKQVVEQTNTTMNEDALRQCDKLRANQYIDECYEYVAMHTTNPNPIICEFLKDPVSHCYAYLAYKTKDATYCDSVNATGIKHDCVALLNLYYLDDVDKCKKVGGYAQDESGQMFDGATISDGYCYSKFAIKDSNIGICDSIWPETKHKDECYYNYAIAKNNCDFVPVSNETDPLFTRSKCFIETGQEEACTYDNEYNTDNEPFFVDAKCDQLVITYHQNFVSDQTKAEIETKIIDNGGKIVNKNILDGGIWVIEVTPDEKLYMLRDVINQYQSVDADFNITVSPDL